MRESQFDQDLMREPDDAPSESHFGLVATERARELIALATSCGSLESDEAVRSLLADPTLLVDLAIDAGGLEQVGWYDEAAKWVGEDLLPRMREETAAASRYEPVYRRTPTEAPDGT